MMEQPKEGDIFRWCWNGKTIKDMEGSKTAMNLYWCCSQICVFKEDNKFWDTYWGGDDYLHDKRFSLEEAEAKLSLEYVGNFEELVKANPSDRAYYLDEDCVNLNHPNQTRGNFYIRKGAKKSLEKMKRVLKRQIKRHEYDAKRAQERAYLLKTDLHSIDADSRIFLVDGVSLFDHSNEDEKDEGGQV